MGKLVLLRKEHQRIFVRHGGDVLVIEIEDTTPKGVRISFDGPMAFDIARDNCKSFPRVPRDAAAIEAAFASKTKPKGAT